MKKRKGFRIPGSKHGRILKNTATGAMHVALFDFKYPLLESIIKWPGCSSKCSSWKYVPRGNYGGLFYYDCANCGTRFVLRRKGAQAKVDALWLTHKVRLPSRPQIIDPLEAAARRGLTKEKRAEGGHIILPGTYARK